MIFVPQSEQKFGLYIVRNSGNRKCEALPANGGPVFEDGDAGARVENET